MASRNRAPWAVKNSFGFDRKSYERDYVLKRKYGISLDKFEEIRQVQGNKCALCFKPFGNTRGLSPVVDHDHLTGVIRGILHSKCNLLLGHLGDNYESVLQALDYLKPSQPCIEEHW